MSDTDATETTQQPQDDNIVMNIAPPPAGDGENELGGKQLGEEKDVAIEEIQFEELTKQDLTASAFLARLRSLDLGCCICNAKVLFLVWMIVFSLPCIFGLVSVLISSQPPAKLFYDSCRNSSGDPVKTFGQREKSIIYPYDTCVACNGNRPYVYTNGTAVSQESQAGFLIIVIVVNIVVTVLATGFFIRLQLKEFTAVWMLSHDVLVEAKVMCSQIVWLVIIIVLCIFASAVNVAYQYYLTVGTSLVPLGIKPNATAVFAFCEAGPIKSHLYAHFNPDNPSTAHAVQLNDGVSVLKAVISSAALFVPLIAKLAGLITKIYSFDVQGLMGNSRISAVIFSELKYSVDIDDLYDAIAKYEDKEDPAEECGCAVCILRSCSLNWSCCELPSSFFGTSFGLDKDAKAVNWVLSILKAQNQLRDYTPEEYEKERFAALDDFERQADRKDDSDSDESLDGIGPGKKNPLAKPKKE